MPIILVDMTQPAFPKPSGEFEWVQASWGAALRCRPLADIAPHWFSTRQLRLEGVGDEGADWKELARALGVEIEMFVRLRQVHGAEVFAADVFPTGRRPTSPSPTIRHWHSASERPTVCQFCWPIAGVALWQPFTRAGRALRPEQ